MALTDEGSGMVMPVAPAYGGGGGFGGFGDNGWWIILLLLCGWGGMGGFGGWGGFGGGMGNMMGLGIDFPWLLNGQQGINNNVSDGFRDAQLHDSVTSVRDGVSNLATQLCGCCGDMQMAVANGFAGVQQSLCNGFAGTTAAVTGAQNALTSQLYQNEIASLNRSFAEQQANQAGFTGVNTGIADLRYTEATEACATRTAAYQNTRDIVDAIRSGNQGIMDKLCQLELDGVKGQYEAAQREIVGLQNQLNMASFRESQANQNALFQQGLNNEVDALYNRLKNCPVGTTPVYGNQPIFTCPQNAYSGCGCGVA
jgi:hypothetical protein